MKRIKTRRVTIKDVASASGVSTQTVSRVINNHPYVSDQKRKHVQDVIDDLEYRPNAIAQSLIRQRSYTLGVVTAGLEHVGPWRTLSGIANATETSGYSLQLKELLDLNNNEFDKIMQTFLSHNVDGVIWAVPEVGRNQSWKNSLSANLDIPIIYLSKDSTENSNVVSINNYLGGQLAMAHLLKQGYRQIGHISGPLDWWEARARKVAWKDTLQGAGIEVKEKHTIEGDWTSVSGSQAIEKLFDQYPEMDAVFAGNDQMALSVLQYACQRGKRIPEDLGVVGFDNISGSAFFWPPLTTVNHDQFAVGRIAVEEIIRMIEAGFKGQKPNQPKSILLAPTLVVRQSSLRKKM